MHENILKLFKQINIFCTYLIRFNRILSVLWYSVEFCGKKTHRCHIGQYHLSNSFTFVTVKTDVQTLNKLTLENNEGAITNGQSRETGNIDEDKQHKNTTQYVLDTIFSHYYGVLTALNQWWKLEICNPLED